MADPAEATQAMTAFMSRWLPDDEVHSWLRACGRFAAGAPEGPAPDPWPAVRAALEETLEAKRMVDLYRANEHEGPDPFTADLTVLLQALPPRRPVPEPDAPTRRSRMLLQTCTQEFLERCQRGHRRPPEHPESLLEPMLGAAEGIPQRRSF